MDVVFHALSTAGVSSDDMADVLMGCLALATLECIPEDVLSRIEDAPGTLGMPPVVQQGRPITGENVSVSGPPLAAHGSHPVVCPPKQEEEMEE